MPTENKEQLFVYIIMTLVFLLFAALVVLIVLLQSKKVKKMFEAQTLRQLEFEQQLLQSQLEVSEQVRLQVAQDLHDNIGTLSSLIKINLGLIETSPSEQQRAGFLTESQNLIKTLIGDVKQLTIGLHAERITAVPFSQALIFEADRIRKLNAFLVNVSITGDEYELPSDKQIIIFRICQELLHNIIKHAKPFKVDIVASFLPGKLAISIEDDGVGFDLAEKKTRDITPGGSGLLNLYHRAKLVGGILNLESSAQKGTRCSLELPV